jgi:PBP1b-binding outer membrane lipoprotein LpoB
LKKLIAASAAALLLAGCSSLMPEEAGSDSEACQKLAELAALDSATFENLTASSLAETLRTDVASLAQVGLATRIEALATELEKEPIAAASLAAAASEIAVRCALVGVSFDFSNLRQLLN